MGGEGVLEVEVSLGSGGGLDAQMACELEVVWEPGATWEMESAMESWVLIRASRLATAVSSEMMSVLVWSLRRRSRYSYLVQDITCR